VVKSWAPPGSLCAACWQGFAFIAAPQCASCGDPFAEHLGDAALCVACLARPPKFRRARACGGWMARAGAELLAEADLIAPVPLHWRRLLTRRYNQALLLARALVRAAPPGVEHRLAPDLLRRHRWTGSQAGLRAKERRSNVRQAFEIHPRWAAEVAGKTVLLVEDVLTTGATAEACARVLQRGGARHVDVLTLARVVRPGV